MKIRNVKKKRDFFFDLFEQQKIPKPFINIAYTHNLGVSLLEQDNCRKLLDNKSFYSIKSVPEYISSNVSTNYTIKKINQYHKGYAILIDDRFSDIDNYLKLKFKSKAREIRRYIKRLETCFDISYKMYFGTISQNEYKALFNALQSMLEIRFKQKKEINDRLLEWQRLNELFYTLINDKKAAIFVIYESNKPISISLNYIFDKFYFNAIASYNINYSKFGLGNVIIYKQLQWCINNKFNLYEMGRGDYDYKRRWSNYVYNLDHYIMVPKKAGVFVLIFSKIEVSRIKLFEYLRSKKVNVLFNNVKSFFYGLRPFNILLFDYYASKISSEEMPLEIKSINFEEDPFLKLQKPINDFLFSNALHKKNIKVYEYDNEFFLKGNNTCQKIIFKQP